MANKNQEAILLDLLRVISHHRARLATPIRTVQKVYRDADLDDVPFSDSPFSWGATSTRPLLLVEPSNKINGEDKIKPHVRPTHINADEDEKATPKSTQSSADGKEDDTKGENIDTKPRETEVGDHSRKEAQTAEAKVGEESGRGTKDVKSSPWDTKKLGNAATKAPNPEEKLQEGIPSTSQVKQDARQQATQAPPPTKPSSLEENIVLGVALDGSKRTLPIDEDTNPEDMKELARLHSGSGPAVTHMEKKDTKQSNTTGSQSSDQKDQQD